MLQALASKLTEAQAQQALPVATSALAWAASEGEAADWARALVALLPRTADRDGTKKLVAAIVYPATAGPATDVLLEAIRARRPDAPKKEAGTEAGLAWLATKYPEVLRSPVCPPPPQPFAISGLKCPSMQTEAATNPLDGASKNNNGGTTY